MKTPEQQVIDFIGTTARSNGDDNLILFYLKEQEHHKTFTYQAQQYAQPILLITIFILYAIKELRTPKIKEI